MIEGSAHTFDTLIYTPPGLSHNLSRSSFPKLLAHPGCSIV